MEGGLEFEPLRIDAPHYPSARGPFTDSHFRIDRSTYIENISPAGPSNRMVNEILKPSPKQMAATTASYLNASFLASARTGNGASSSSTKYSTPTASSPASPISLPSPPPVTAASPSQRNTKQESLLKKIVQQQANCAKSSSDMNKILPENVSGRTTPSNRGSISQQDGANTLKPTPADRRMSKDGVGIAFSDTPLTSAPGSPKGLTARASSTASTPRVRPTTLDIPGVTRSKVSPDGRISQRDVGAKLVIIMVGLPARGKSYITKKVARYLNWCQHSTRIFNVGERRRVLHHGPEQGEKPSEKPLQEHLAKREDSGSESGDINKIPPLDPPTVAATILINGHEPNSPSVSNGASQNGNGSFTGKYDHTDKTLSPHDRAHFSATFPQLTKIATPEPPQSNDDHQSHSAEFFDPENRRAAALREQVALETLDELLDYILVGGGSVGIFDATNSTLERRKSVMQHIRKRAGNELNVLFVESVCNDDQLVEANMRLKLSGPDYKGQDPEKALADFRRRVAMYEKAYVTLGEYEELHNMPYVQLVDVGRKVISHQVKGFLAAQTVYYLTNFNLAPRQIWITRHGESKDNVLGRIGGDADLAPTGRAYAKALSKFLSHQRVAWESYQIEKARNTHFPPHPGDHTPPNPYYHPFESEDGEEAPLKNFCVWTSMLKRAIQTSEYFDEEEFDVKQIRVLDEIYAGHLEGLTYQEIAEKYPVEFQARKRDKLRYRYPGPGGEGYLDVINRMRQIIIELERMDDHILLITHRSVARVLLAYFKGLSADEVAEVACPLGMLYCLEPKPYGVDFKVYQYNKETDWFDLMPHYELRRQNITQQDGLTRYESNMS